MVLSWGLTLLLQLYFFAPVLNERPLSGTHDERLPVASRIRDRIMGRLPGRQLNKKEICYDMVGCFDVPRKRSLKKMPQSPQRVDTKFWLYTRETTKDLIPVPRDQLLMLRNVSQLIEYNDDGESLGKSSFEASKPLKVLIHGFKGSGKDKGALAGVQEFLKLEDVNVLIVDWEKGASDSYPTAAANTELIGRQTAVMLLDMIAAGAKPKDIHVVGFSLGAHIAGCAGDMIKNKGSTLGRITGLDPASPFFKHQFVRESSTKLDASDADFVDIIHTDGSPVFTDGFGLLRPIGHVDFFPNGGREQPGCSDGRGSVVVSTLEGTINSSVACSHVRAWELFLESMVNLQDSKACQFVGYPCAGGGAQFADARCFLERPLERCSAGDTRCNVMGMGVNKDGARGVLYLSTRASSPFCGEQVQAVVAVTERTEPTRGYLHMQLLHSNGYNATNFRFTHELSDEINGRGTKSAVAVAEMGSLDIAPTDQLQVVFSFQSLEFQNGRPNVDVYLGEVSLKNSRGTVWRTCQDAGLLKYLPESSFSTLPVNLTLSQFCH